ncbi:MAG: methyltransferase domain-containing protein, partial [Acidimicrobiales bacterium]
PVSFAATDGEALPFPDGSFDVVTCDDVIEHVFDQPKLVEELARVTRPGGRLLLVTPNASGFHVLLARARHLARGRRLPREAYHITQSHVRELRWRELHDLVRPWFRVVQALPMTFPDRGRWRRLNTVIRRAPTGARLGPIHFFVLERAATDAAAGSSGHAGHYAARTDSESQTSPGVVRAAFDAAREELPLTGLVLDLGCGGGANLQALERDGIPAVGVDVSLSALEGAIDAAPRVVADAARLPFRPGAFGSAVCTEVLEHVDVPSAVLAEVSRVLSPGGRLYVTVPNYANLAGVHKLWADRRSGRHDWNPWGAHEGGYEAFMTGRRLWSAARESFDLERVRALDYGQAITGRFPVLDRVALTSGAQRVLRAALPRLHRPGRRFLSWHGMHTELVLRRRAGAR